MYKYLYGDKLKESSNICINLGQQLLSTFRGFHSLGIYHLKTFRMNLVK